MSMDNLTHHMIPHYKKVNAENVTGVMKCRYCNKGTKDLPPDPTMYVCKDAILQSGLELALPKDWERMTGIRVMDADGWGNTRVKSGDITLPVPRMWDEPICVEEWEARISVSTAFHPARPRF